MIKRILYCLSCLMMTLLAGACSENNYGSLYCPPGARDTLVVYPRLEFEQLTVTAAEPASPDADTGVAGMESLYLGSSGETQSTILLNFDFSNLDSLGLSADMFTVENIQSVELMLRRLRPYWARADSQSLEPLTPWVIYRVQALNAPFDPGDYVQYPGPEPDVEGTVLNEDLEVNTATYPRLRLFEGALVNWVRERATVGLAVSAAVGSGGGLVGFGASELKSPSLVNASYMEAFPLGPLLFVRFGAYLDTTIVFIPSNDTSTFHSVASVWPELAKVQTGMRSYPVLTYDIPSLPAGTIATWLSYRLTLVDVDSLWSSACLPLDYLDPTAGNWSGGSIAEDELGVVANSLFLLCPGYAKADGSLRLRANLNKDIGMPLPEVMHLMIHFPDPAIDSYNWGSSVNMSRIYFSQSSFYGPSAPPEFRPTLTILTGRQED